MVKKYWITDVQLGMLVEVKSKKERQDIADEVAGEQTIAKSEDISLDDVETNEELDANTDTSGYIDHIKEEGSWGESNQDNDYDNKYGGSESK